MFFVVPYLTKNSGLPIGVLRLKICGKLLRWYIKAILKLRTAKSYSLPKKLETFEMFKGESVHDMSGRLKDIICHLTALEKHLSALSLEDAIRSLQVFEIDQEREKLVSRKRSAEQNE
ncbi:hypothetical protein Tco_1485113 [Tanacetum coccineum]